MHTPRVTIERFIDDDPPGIVACCHDDETWRAQKDGRRFQANNPAQLPGLVSMVELRGPDWQAGDIDIDAFLGIYGGQAS